VQTLWKTGHDEAGCYKLISYPLGWNTRGGRGARDRGRGGRGTTRCSPGRGGRGATAGAAREVSYVAQHQGEHGGTTWQQIAPENCWNDWCNGCCEVRGEVVSWIRPLT